MSDKASCEHIPDIVELLLKSYADLGGINHIEGVNLPDRGAVQTITDGLLRLVFPGFYETVGVHAAALRYHVGASVSSLAERLQTEIRRSLSISPEASEAAGDPDRLICEFLKAIPGIRETVSIDHIKRGTLRLEGIRFAVLDEAVSYTHLRAHETVIDLVCRLLLEKKNRTHTST